jgi:hypothetical protein
VWWNAGREEDVVLEALEHDALTSRELTRVAEMLVDNACPRWMVDDEKMPHMHACMYLFNTHPFKVVVLFFTWKCLICSF